jgi:hypothetical protein
MAAGGDPNLPISDQQAKSWAKDASQQPGGYDHLILHDSRPGSWE